jgi:uncharacterized protein YqeY
MEKTMNIYERMKEKLVECMKAKQTYERDVLKTVIGEIQSKSVGSGKEITDELVEKTLVSFKENAQECLKYSKEKENVLKEIEVYELFLPEYESVENIVKILEANANQLRSAKGDGPATGMAMGILKKSGIKIQGKDVAEAVKQIRSS